MKLLLTNIGKLIQAEKHPPLKRCGAEMAFVPTIPDAFLLMEDGLISEFGPMAEVPLPTGPGVEILDVQGRYVFPSFCDSHTHLVYAGSREIEYTDKIRGLSYEEIARRGGGILNSARRLSETPEDDLYEQSMARIREIISLGTGAVEIKSGYGLDVENELKMLRVIRRISETSPVTVVPTFLGAHALPAEYRARPRAFVDLVIHEMLPRVAEDNLARYMDVFCDRGFFTVEDTHRILEAALTYGLRPKIHANELDYSGGIQVGVRHQALSVDHLEYTGPGEIACLLESDTMPTLLPGASFFLNLVKPPARAMINAGLPIAMASDFNPGSSPSGNMKLVMSFGCVDLRLLPEEALNAVTLNSAYAMGLSTTHGSISPGKVANVFITKKIPSLEYMPYAYGSNLVEKVILKGQIIAPESVW